MKNRSERINISSEIDEITPKQQTLIIGGWTSICGNCGGNADLSETKHEMRQMAGAPGCNVEWKYITTDGIDSSYVTTLRPDLEWIEPDLSQDGATNAMEDRTIGDLEVMGPLKPKI